MRFLQLLPEKVALSSLAAISGGASDISVFERAVTEIDWESHRDVLEDLLRELLPIEELVPTVYEKWRPVVRDGFSFIAARLSQERLMPKLVEQLTLPDKTPVEERIFIFIRRIPIFQKIGQTMARNISLDAGFRAQLSILEDGIREVDEVEIRSEIENQIGDLQARHGVVLQSGLYGEGSVSALLQFTYKAPQDIEHPSGVFKVLKPFITRYFEEDLTLLAELADYFDANQKSYNLDKVNLRAILNNVRELYERETDFINERESLIAAGRQYSTVPGIRIPQPIPSLSTDTITAMTEERSVKITDAFLGDTHRRRELTRKLIECLVARPLFSSEEISPFHADPHAGNLRVDEKTGDIVLLDWALTGNLTTADRRSLILLFVTLPLRDEGQVLAALSELSLSKDKTDRDLIKRVVEIFMDALPLGSIPASNSLGDLIDSLLRAGAQFSGSFLIFRKMLSTLGDVVENLAPGETIQHVVVEYAVTNGLLSALGPGIWQQDFKIPLNGIDLFRIGLSAQSFLPRVWGQSVRSIARSSGIFISNVHRTESEQD
jgi:ubiquinone biosynthesis protein